MKTLGKGIYQDRYGIRAIVNSAEGRKEKRFPAGTPLRDIARWRNEMKVKLLALGRQQRQVQRIPMLPRDLEGWCYLYVIAGSDVVKIGRSLNPHTRLYELQSGHDVPLQLLVAVPIHASLEKAIHRRFDHLKRQGEWFELSAEMTDFIAHLQNGLDPVLYLWNVTTLHGKVEVPVLRKFGKRRPLPGPPEWLM